MHWSSFTPSPNLIDFAASCWFTSTFPEWGWPEFALIVDMRSPEMGLVVGDCCILEADVSVEAIASDGTMIPTLYAL